MNASGATFVHPSALCESEAIGHGTRIWAFAHVMKGAIIGADCNIGDHAFIEGGARLGNRVTIKNQVMVWDGVEIGDDVFVGPGATFTNDLHPRSPRMALPAVAERYRDRAWLGGIVVAQGATLGARCVILPDVTIGAYAMVGAGAVVTRDVAAHALVLGVPARAAGWVCRCGSRLVPLRAGIWECPSCPDRYNEESSAGCTRLTRSS